MDRPAEVANFQARPPHDVLAGSRAVAAGIPCSIDTTESFFPHLACVRRALVDTIDAVYINHRQAAHAVVNAVQGYLDERGIRPVNPGSAPEFFQMKRVAL